MSHKLTIAIPTYNPRNDFLKDALTSIAKSVIDFRRQVEVLIVSNGSTQESVSEINYLETIFVDFRFVYEDKNLGYDRNVNRLFEHALGDFVWIFGDDDLLFPHSISSVLSALNQKENISFLVTRPVFFSEHVLEASFDPESSSSIVDISGFEGFSEIGFLPAAVSTVCMKKSAWQQIDSAFSFGSNWVHFVKIEQLLSSNNLGRGLLLDFDLVAIRRADSNRWESHFGSQFSSGLALLEISKQGINHEIDSKIITWIYSKRFSTNFLDLLWLFRPKNLKEMLEMYKRQELLFSKEIRFWFIDVPIIFLPNQIRTFVVKVLSKTKSILLS